MKCFCDLGRVNYIFGTALALLVFCYNSPEARSQKPNVIIIYADDLGIGLLGHEGQKIIKTPNIDKLAQQGLRFNRAYSNMLCAPARASLITGLHDCHQNGFEITKGGAYIQADKDNFDEIQQKIEEGLSPIEPDQLFLGQVAKEAGYTTAQFGKLEWGFSATHKQMKRHGWDYYLGYLDHVRAHGFYPPFLIENGEMLEIEGNTLANCGKSGEPETPKNFEERWNRSGKETYSQDIFMKGILNFIDNHKKTPFFLYFPTQLPHGPVSIPQVHPDFVNDTRLTQIEKEYASMVKLLDDNVGQILTKLKELKIDDNTVIIFTADNGHEIYYSKKGRVTKPYTNILTNERFDDYKNKYYSNLSGDIFDGNGGRAGMKRSNLEGGINVPLIVRWPQRVKPGQINSRLTPNYDILPTVAEICGYSERVKSDGISFFDELVGKKNGRFHKEVVYSSYYGPTLITNEGWKLRSHLSKDAFELFYLPSDPKEKNDLSKFFPEKFEELKHRLLKLCDGDLQNGYFSD